MNTSLEITPICETRTEIQYLFGEQTLPILAITITLIITIEIVLRFFLLGRRRKRIERAIEKRFEELNIEEEKVFFRFLKRKMSEVSE